MKKLLLSFMHLVLFVSLFGALTSVYAAGSTVPDDGPLYLKFVDKTTEPMKLPLSQIGITIENICKYVKEEGQKVLSCGSTGEESLNNFNQKDTLNQDGWFWATNKTPPAYSPGGLQIANWFPGTDNSCSLLGTKLTKLGHHVTVTISTVFKPIGPGLPAIHMIACNAAPSS